MSAITTYGDLKKAVELWINRTDDVTKNAIPTFISFALQDFQRVFYLPQFERTMVNLALAGGTVRLPSDYYEMKSVEVDGIPYNRVDLETFNRIKSGEFGIVPTKKQLADDISLTALVQGNPNSQYVFMRQGNDLHFIPELKDGAEVALTYWQKLTEDLNLDTDTSPVLEVAPDIMLYLSLRHASVFLRDLDMEQFWAAKAETAGAILRQKLDEIEWSGSSLVVPAFRR